MFAKGIRKPLLFSLIILLILSWIHFFVYPNLSLIFFGFLLLFFIFYFFRDPERHISEGITSPADGKVVSVDEDRNSIEIFMNIWDVHVNRAPISGVVKKLEHIHGGYSPAYSERSKKNEKHLYQLRSEDDRMIKLWQIAGIFARRIVPYVQKKDQVEKGDRIGMIRFGSRVKLEFSEEVDFAVEEGQKVRAGETTLGDWNG